MPLIPLTGASPWAALDTALATPGDAYERRLALHAGLHHRVARPVHSRRLYALSTGFLRKAYANPDNPLEDVEQVDLAEYLRTRDRHPPLVDTLTRWTHPANEGASKGENGRKKARGLSSGTPDMLLWGGFSLGARTFNGLAIELKRRRGVPSNVSDAQAAWLRDLRREGWLSVWCKGAGPAVAVVELCYGMSWLPGLDVRRAA